MKKSASASKTQKNKYTAKEKIEKSVNSNSQQSSFFAFPYTNSQNETKYIYRTHYRIQFQYAVRKVSGRTARIGRKN